MTTAVVRCKRIPLPMKRQQLNSRRLTFYYHRHQQCRENGDTYFSLRFLTFIMTATERREKKI